MIISMSAGPEVSRDGSVLEGALERITYANPETGYTIARIDAGHGPDLITAVGPLLGAQVGESLRMRGRWTSHPKYGKQFEVFSYTTVLPATVQGIQRYLGSGLIKGIGPVMAERMVKHFGVDIMHIIDDTPGRLIEVDGLGPKRTAMITAAWAEQKAIKEVMVFLQGVGVSTSLAVKIYKKYGDKSVDVVRAEPYRLASDVWGIGFKTADTIAMSVGIARDSPERIKAGLAYTLSEAADDGHCYLPVPNLITDAAKILEVPAEMIAPCLDELAAVEGVVREDLPPAAEDSPPVPAVYLPPFYQAERSVAAALLRLLSAREDRLAGFASVDWDKALGWLRKRTGAALAPEQEEAVKLALTSRVAVLTGGPGCGKSFTVRSVVELAKARRAKIILAAPTGRAAKRLAELTGHEAATIHRLLQLRPGGDASFDTSNPLDTDLVVVDETSMVDVILANKLIKAIPPGAHLLLVGDVDQLPSVGAGEVLRDMLAARTLPEVRLTKIFRQAQQSGIVVNAHKINAGDQPSLAGFGDFFWFSCDEVEETAALVVDIVARRIPAKFGLDPRRDVQVLCPMHRGPAGAGNLNLLLQEALTPYREGQPERRYGGRVFRVGDKVTQLRNNYEKGAAGVFNGTVGVVTGMSPEDHKLTVRTDEDESIDYGFDELDELTHAYAVTIHRSQGSEYPAVVIPLTMGSYLMLQRNLLYTGVTRAKKLVVLAGSRRALAVAVRTKGSGRRHTALDYRLRPAGLLPVGVTTGPFGTPPVPDTSDLLRSGARIVACRGEFGDPGARFGRHLGHAGGRRGQPG
jgi:exodeoxyribonuclease V alpha subunit